MKLIAINKNYPRPDFRRRHWQYLDGEWDFAFDYSDTAIVDEVVFDKKIIVPFVYQSILSTINSSEKHEVVWYKRTFHIDDKLKNQECIHINFGAVDYEAQVWINGHYLGNHQGGYSQFSFDITPYMIAGENTIVVKVRDNFDRHMPRGKQYCNQSPDRCWYEASTGIWQSVWLEASGKSKIEHALITPSIKKRTAAIELYIENLASNMSVKVCLSYRGAVLSNNTYSINNKINRITLDIKEIDFVDEKHYWSPESPNLFDVHMELMVGDKISDEVSTYFGMREIEVRDGIIILNNKPYYQKLILDQGYYEDSLLTPPNVDILESDLKIIKEYGFNGVRRHQVISDPRFYYYADVLGLLIWEEVPSGYEFCYNEMDAIYRQSIEFIKRDYNHPSIIAWCPMNESWGIRNVRYDNCQQSFVKALYHLYKSFDPTRLVSCNDGWEVVGGDFIAQHNYFQGGKDFENHVGNIVHYSKGAVSGCRMSLADNEQLGEIPLILSEFGGISFVSDDGWGYCDAVANEEEFFKRFQHMIEVIYTADFLQGFCYTQFTDVFQETNGLLKMNREAKVSAERVREILDKKRNY